MQWNNPGHSPESVPDKNALSEHSSSFGGLAFRGDGVVNPYESPHLERDYTALVEPLRSTIEHLGRELQRQEIPLGRFYQTAFDSLNEVGVLSGNLDAENLLRVNRILEKSRRWLPLAERLGQVENGLEADYVCRKGLKLGESARDDTLLYASLKDSLRAEMLDEVAIVGVLSAEQFLDRIQDVLLSDEVITEERRTVLVRKLQTELQSDVVIDRPLAKYFHELAWLPITPIALRDSALTALVDDSQFSSEDFDRAIEVVAKIIH
jgi:hypothetical protein